MIESHLELAVASVLVAILVGLAGYFGWRQWQTLRGLAKQPALENEDRHYYRNQGWRRLAICLLMLIFAGMLAGSYVLGFNTHADELAHLGRAGNEGPVPLTAAQKQFLHLYSAYWIVASMVLLAMVLLAAVDFWAIRRFGLRHLRQIRADRREMIEKERSTLRSQRNGHG